jgi:preprotein translocase subunit SecF
MRLFEHANYPFLQWRRRAYILSAVLILGGVAMMVRNAVQYGSWLNYGIDFTGGTTVVVRFDRPVAVEQIRAVAPDWEISHFGSDREVLIRFGGFQQALGQDAAARVTEALRRRFPAGSFDIERVEAVGPKVGQELQRKALIALAMANLLTLVYLAIRFEWRFGVAAVAATVHDILITLGILATLRTTISTETVAAFLTIVGYSLNDTIVIFDRIRENLRQPGAGRHLAETLNRSVNETLSRTALTGGSALATLLSLMIFGGPVIREFAVVLTLGIVVGTFSSIFVATPILYEIEQRWPSPQLQGARVPAARTAGARR